MGKIKNSRTLSTPEPLTDRHQCSDFSCGEPALDEWLKRRALKSQREGAARTYVVCSDNKVIGYFSLAAGSLARTRTIAKVRRNMPDPVPVMLLARLAVDIQWQKLGLGCSMLQDAALRTLQAAEIAGIRAMAVHAIALDAKRFYQYFGFRESDSEPMSFMVTIGDLEAAFLLCNKTSA